MQINTSKFVGIITGVLSVLLVLYLGYFLVNLFFIGNSSLDPRDVKNIKAGLFGQKAQKAASALTNANEKIALSKTDLLFTTSSLYKSFTETPDPVPMTEERGRPDPFVPYVAP